MPGEYPFSRRITLTQARNLMSKRAPPPWLSQWHHLTLTPLAPLSTSSPETGQSKKCSPPQKTRCVRNAGSSATSPIAVPTHTQFIPSARSPTPKQSMAALTLPALRVAISNLSSPAVHPRWHAALTARKSTLRAAGIAPPAPKPLPMQQKCYCDRRRTAWISLKTRLALRQFLTQHQVPLPEPRVPLYSPAMLLHLGREPIVPSPSPISPQERAVINL